MPAKKPCLDCGKPSLNARCAEHARAKKGSTKARGLSGEHARISREFKRLDLPCALCGRHGTPRNPITAGHLLPRVMGGTNSPYNYQPECRECNSRKGASSVNFELPRGGKGEGFASSEGVAEP